MNTEIIIQAFEELKSELKALKSAVDKSNNKTTSNPAIEDNIIKHLDSLITKDEVKVHQAVLLSVLKLVLTRIDEYKMNIYNKIEEQWQQGQDPRKVIHQIDFSTLRNIIILAVTGISFVVLAFMFYYSKMENIRLLDNDLKYRYIKMKGSPTPKLLIELEDIFELNRDKDKIEQMHDDVNRYEEVIRKRAIVEEQEYLKSFEVTKLKWEAESLKNK